MATDRELLEAKKLASFHDGIRRKVTVHLRWALEVMDAYKDRMPKEDALARMCHAAATACKESEKLSELS